jgi:hypothetical protein
MFKGCGDDSPIDRLISVADGAYLKYGVLIDLSEMAGKLGQGALVFTYERRDLALDHNFGSSRDI